MSIFVLNFTLQDIIGATLAFFLFPLVIVFPGYVCGWALDLFDFKQRQLIVRLGIGLILSFVISPIIFDLTSSLLSLNFSLLTVGGFAGVFAIIFLKERSASTPETTHNTKTILWIGGIWVVFAILSQIDIQWKDQLYISVLSYDQTTRVSLIDAITRTGVPPINPTYYPGHPVQLTFLYYFWYILSSLIDIIGGTSVNARDALSASAAWSGLGLMAIVALYLRMRNTNQSESAWRISKIGIGLLAISGLDAILFILFMANPANTEHWNTIQFASVVWNNMQFAILTMVFTWIVSILFVPHHVAALVACLSAVMLVHSARGKTMPRQITILTIAGLGFASSIGLSVWITLVFVIFWCIWLIVLFLQKSERSLILPMIFAGVVAVFLASPFLIGILKGGGADGQPPIIFEIRSFIVLEPFVKELSPILHSIIMLAILPIDYLFELGFFFIAGIYWFKIKSKETFRSNPFYLSEVLLLIVVLFIVSFLRSTQLISNDLGTRGWLPGQFILLIWGVDIIEVLFFHKNDTVALPIKSRRLTNTRNFLRMLIVIGISTSLLDAVFLRIFWPAWGGTEFGQNTYSARLAYDYLRDHIPADAITQNNPLDVLDRPSGLYGTHQMVIEDRTAFGVPSDVFHKLANEVGVLFIIKNAANWQVIDEICQQHSIDVLILKDTDPIWNSLSLLKTQRPALYENTHYALFACGDYAK